MKLYFIFTVVFLSLFSAILFGQQNFQTDTFKTKAGDVKIHFIGHGTLMFEMSNKIMHIDPFDRLADYEQLPDADYVLITHHHGDHLDPAAIEKIKKRDTKIILTQSCKSQIPDGTVMQNGDKRKLNGIIIEAVPAYNIEHKRNNGEPYHPKGDGNGYVVSIGGMKIYIAGDTENIPEMSKLEDIHVAFLPMNLPYTMTPEMVADAARSFQPDILYPYHYGETDPQQLNTWLENQKNIEVRIRNMK